MHGSTKGASTCGPSPSMAQNARFSPALSITCPCSGISPRYVNPLDYGPHGCLQANLGIWACRISDSRYAAHKFASRDTARSKHCRRGLSGNQRCVHWGTSVSNTRLRPLILCESLPGTQSGPRLRPSMLPPVRQSLLPWTPTLTDSLARAPSTNVASDRSRIP